MEYNLAFKKRGNFAICDNMEECGGHYSMWNKPDTGQNTAWYHFLENPMYKGAWSATIHGVTKESNTT